MKVAFFKARCYNVLVASGMKAKAVGVLLGGVKKKHVSADTVKSYIRAYKFLNQYRRLMRLKSVNWSQWIKNCKTLADYFDLNPSIADQWKDVRK